MTIWSSRRGSVRGRWSLMEFFTLLRVREQEQELGSDLLLPYFAYGRTPL